MALLPLSRLKGFGGKLGVALKEKMNVTTVSELLGSSKNQLRYGTVIFIIAPSVVILNGWLRIQHKALSSETRR